MSNTIHQEISFRTSPEQIYEVLTNSKRFGELTKASAEIDRLLAGNFHALVE